MSKKIIILVALVIFVPLAYFLISPLWRDINRSQTPPVNQEQIKDNLAAISETRRNELTAEVARMKSEAIRLDEDKPESGRVTARARLASRAYPVSGKVEMIDQNGQEILRFTDLKLTPGPELHIYLASEFSSRDFVDLGEVRATEGSVNYAIPEGTDVNRYNKVLIWSKPFGVIFGYAVLEIL